MSVAGVTRAGAWSAADVLLRQLSAFIVSVILARLLSPGDFGLVALVSFFSSLSIVFVQGGITLALVQRQNTTPEQETAVFWTNVCAAVLFALVLIAIVPLLAQFYGYPLLALLMYVAAAQVVLSSLGAVHTALLTRAMRFDQLTKAGVGSSIVSGIAGIAAAMAGWGVWALALQILVQGLVGNAALWLLHDWRPSWRCRFSAIRDFLGFGAHIGLSSALEIVFTQGFALLIGKLHGVQDLGLFNRAISTQSLTASVFNTMLVRVTLPMFAERADDPEALRSAFIRALRFMVFINTPIVFGVALVAEPLLYVLFGGQWITAAPVLALLSVGGFLMPFHVLNLQLLLGTGKSSIYLRLDIHKKVVSIAIIAVGSYFGIIGLAVALNIAGVYSFFVNIAPVSRLYQLNWLVQIRRVQGVLAATMFMSAVCLLVKLSVEVTPVLELTIVSCSGAVAYLTFFLVVKVEAFEDARLLLTNLLSQRQGRIAS